MNEDQMRVAGDEMAAALPGDQAPAWVLRITYDGLKRRLEQAYTRAQRAQAELDAARAVMDVCETNLKAIGATLKAMKADTDG